MTLREAQTTAMGAKKDLVLRNSKVDPPVVKIMNYKKELLKRLFKKLGKEMDQKDMKTKSIRLATTISFHDLENKKKQAQQLLKNFQILKFYMKVNIYDPENVQKGRMMLLNIAEDLKADAKVTVSPQKDDQTPVSTPGEQKPKTMDEIEEAAMKSKQMREEFVAIQYEDGQFDDDYDSDQENQEEYIFMELRSTATFKDIDIDAMLEHTTFDDFMKGLYANRIASESSGKKGDRMQSEFEAMW
jgi:translation initiation factor IF-3